MFKERTDSHWKAFGSKEYSSYLPYLSATYTSESFSDEGLGVTHGRTYYVKNRRSGKYLTNSGNYSEANVYQSEFSGNDNQKWCFAYLDDGYYKIIPINAIGKCLDLWCGSSSPSGDEMVLTYRYTLIMAVIIKNGNWFEAGTEHIDL